MNSIRQVPVSATTAKIIDEYVSNYRGRPNHSYLLNSQKNKPLSTEGLTKIFSKIAGCLSIKALKELEARTGKLSITPHDLRHTCAVIRLTQFLGRGDDMENALQNMQSFFGWSAGSNEPRRYARAVFEDRIAAAWGDYFDDRVALLRSIPAAVTIPVQLTHDS